MAKDISTKKIGSGPKPTIRKKKKVRVKSAQLDHILVEYLVKLLSEIPISQETRPAAPKKRARRIARFAALQSAAVSGAFALPCGPLALMTVLPDLLAIWQIQRQLIADVASIYGQRRLLSRELMLYCLFGHSAAVLMKDFVVRVEERVLVNPQAPQILMDVLKQISRSVTHSFLTNRASRLIPFAGVLAVGGFAYHDTRQVAETTIDLLSRKIVLENLPKTKARAR